MSTLRRRLRLLLIVLALPIVVVYGIIVAIQINVESKRATQQAELLLNEEIAHHAAQCDTIFAKAAESAQGLADFIEVAKPETTEQVTAYLKTLLTGQIVIVGSGVVYEPHQFNGNEAPHIPYLYKPENASDVGEMVGRFRYKDLANDKNYTTYDWYTAPVQAKHPVWTEPYYDTAGAGELMCSYCVPAFAPSGELKFIATIDISLDTIRDIASHVDTEGATCILFSAKDMVIASPDAEWEMKETLNSLLTKWGIDDPEGVATAIHTRQAGAGSRHAYSSQIKGGVYFSFVHLPASGWTLVVKMRQSTITAKVYKKVITSAAIFAAGMVVLIIAIVLVASRAGTAVSKAMTQAAAATQREHEAFVKDVFSSIQDGVFTVDSDYRILRTNRVFEEMYKDLLPLVGRRCWETARFDRICDDCPAEKMFLTGKAISTVHYKDPTPTHQGMWLEHMSHPVFDDNQNIVGAINFIRDISSRKALENELHQYQTNLEHLVEERTTHLYWSESKMKAVLAGNISIVFYNIRGIIETINPVLESVLGYTKDEFVGKSLLDFIQKDYRKRMADLMQQTIVSNELTEPRMEVPVLHKDGHTIWFDCCISEIRDTNGRIAQFVLLGMDVTEKRNLVASLEVAKRHAETATRAKSDFLANMSHEIRTPMNAIIGLTHLCLKTKLTDTQRDFLEKSHAASLSLLDIVNDILDFSTIEAGKMKIANVPFRLSELIDDVNNIAAVIAQEKGLALTAMIDDSIPDNLVSDPLRLRKVILNLVGNAIKFTEKGSVDLVVAKHVNTDANAAVDAKLGRVWLSFTVRDTGIGMSEDQMKLLFASFSQADTSSTRKYGGTGLGLAISQNVIDLMGGKISVSSVVGRGTSFCFTLPFTIGASDQVQEKPGIMESAVFIDPSCDFTGKRVLLVEDNKINQIVAQGLLQAYNVNLTIANDGAEALALVKAQNFDLVFMDIQMPNMDGLEATKAIRGLNKPGIDKLPILAMTAHAMESDYQKSFEAGMNDHLTKPIDPKKLRAALLKWLGKNG